MHCIVADFKHFWSNIIQDTETKYHSSLPPPKSFTSVCLCARVRVVAYMSKTPYFMNLMTCHVNTTTTHDNEDWGMPGGMQVRVV